MKSTSLRTPLLCLGLLSLAACGKGKEQGPPQMPPPEVGVVKAQVQSTPLTKDLVGRVSAYRSADVRARVSGVLLKRAYQEGTDVKQGQILFEIDPAVYQAALASSVANLASAQATYVNYHKTADRLRQLLPQHYVSQSDVDAAEANERSSAAAVKQAEAAVQSARINLSYTHVESPIDGRAGQQQVTEGAIVGASNADTGSSSTLLTTVDQLDPLYVNFTVSSADLDRLRAAQTAGNVSLSDQAKTTVKVTLPDGSTYDQAGTLDFSGATVDPTTGAVNLRALLANPQRRLLPGTYVTITANLGEQHNVFLVPQPSVLRDVVGAYALVVESNGNVQRKNVSAENLSNGNWIVTNGLSAGDQVIVSGLQAVQPGKPAKATPYQPDQKKGAQGQPAAAGQSGSAAGKQ
ncbi:MULTISPECIES: efflux RND transporter periplasmic adaptor subunit [Dyella]|uniref:efflux RND transporter periplasmic adaptor subunit n=1 Tax=Dyella TaxID=231454 RepID=UPI000C859042|nr:MULTISPECIES: efflux RND transporter periplasmic adaptor subunit [Dyella]MDR3447666.1 efflux RND transporter periplasmic adaptor subunit [Dyella sp.]PMQ02643.1 Multidrug resistance protein MexA [Dyella sp. AD56]ULU24554.1 efflux RND transporter periplasmic adaptor subunit [Dyella terrae]